MFKIKTIKRAVSVFTTIGMTLAMSSSAYAESNQTNKVTAVDESFDHNIQATYNEDTYHSYHVDITWGSLEYKYTKGLWNPDTHKYEPEMGMLSLRNKDDTDGNKITFTNHSNTPVNLHVTFIPGDPQNDDAKWSDAKMDFTCDEITGRGKIVFQMEACAEGSDSAPTKTVTVTPILDEAFRQMMLDQVKTDEYNASWGAVLRDYWILGKIDIVLTDPDIPYDPDYDSERDRSNPNYDPTLDDTNPLCDWYDPYLDPVYKDGENYDPDYDPTNKESPNYNPNVDPTNKESPNYDEDLDPTNPNSFYYALNEYSPFYYLNPESPFYTGEE